MLFPKPQKPTEKNLEYPLASHTHSESSIGIATSLKYGEVIDSLLTYNAASHITVMYNGREVTVSWIATIDRYGGVSRKFRCIYIKGFDRAYPLGPDSVMIMNAAVVRSLEIVDQNALRKIKEDAEFEQLLLTPYIPEKEKEKQ
jgi:hypothetical protein